MTTVNVHNQTLTLKIGDSKNWLFTACKPDTVDPTLQVPFDLTIAKDGTLDRRALIRMAGKEDPSDPNTSGIFYLTTYDTSQILYLTQAGSTLGQFRALLDKPDTQEANDGTFCWDIEISRADFARPGASVGTLTYNQGAKTVVGVGTQFTKAKKYDLLYMLDNNLENPVLITKIIDDLNMEVESSLLENEAGATFEIWRPDHDTAGSGPLVLEPGQVSP